MSHAASSSRRLLLVLYVGFWSLVLAAAGAGLTRYLAGTLGDPLAGQGRRTADPKVFDSVVALTEKKIVHYLGEWEFLEPKLPGHFHHIGRWYEADTRNFCIKCHGQTPHAKSPQARAFLNMHNLFTACQTCHVREQQAGTSARFGWVDIASGRLCVSPDMTEHPWGEYGAKIAPVTGSPESPQLATLPEEEAFAAEFLQRMGKLGDQQKVIANRFIHRRCTETPVRCSECHSSQQAFLPYISLGYAPERATYLMSTEVADLVARYETFHIPTLLKAEKPAPAGTEDKKE